jgi:hypothetical protein
MLLGSLKNIGASDWMIAKGFLSHPILITQAKSSDTSYGVT